MSFEFLWTDQCFLGLLFLSLVALIYSLRKPHVRQSLALIGQRPIAVGAGLILLLFLVIAILDSIHVRTPSEETVLTSTLLDRIMAPVGTVYEKTYSAPLALTLYSPQTVSVRGVSKQIKPHLEHINQEIKTKQDRNKKIQRFIHYAFSISLGLTVGFWFIILLGRRLLKGRWDTSITAVLATAVISFFILTWVSLACFYLSRHLHVLGTGQIGQDIFYYAIKSIRTGLVIGVLTTLFMLPLALILGVASGYFGGLIDDIIQYIYTTLSSIPGVLLITASILSMQTWIANHPEQFNNLAKSADARLLILCLILGVTSWTSLCRLLRAESLKLREVDYVMAARALGSSSWTILRKHLLPNVAHIVLITLVLDFSFLVLAEAVLSYVGVGVSPMTISWGNMINSARLELAREPLVWWPMFAAFIFMFVLVLASNLFADVVRDAFDPRRQ